MDRWKISIACFAALFAILAVFAPFILRDIVSDRDLARAWVEAVRRGEDTAGLEAFDLHADADRARASRGAMKIATAVTVPWLGDLGSATTCFNGRVREAGGERSLAIVVGHRDGGRAVAQLAIDHRCTCPSRGPCRIVP